MIFKTFDSTIDKISSKWGVFGRSFNEIGAAIAGRINDIKTTFQSTRDVIGSFRNSDGIFKRLYPNKTSIQSQLIDVDTIIPKIDKSTFDFDSWIETLNDIDKKVKVGTMSWQDYSDGLDKNKRWIAKWGQQTQGQIRTQEDLILANQKAREAAIKHNQELKNSTLAAKAGQTALQGLAMTGNMLVIGCLTLLFNIISQESFI